MTFQEYLAIDALNWSTLKAMEDSPLAMVHRRDTPSPDTPARVLGRATHTAVLEPDRFETEVITYDGTRRGKAWEAFRDANEARTILNPREHDACHAMSEAVRSDAAAWRYLVHGEPELSLQWTDPETGIACKGRIDWLTVIGGEIILTDLKSARDITERGIGKACAQYGYHGQLAFYVDGLAALGVRVDRVVMVAVSNQEPHDVGVFYVETTALEVGREWYRSLLARYVECRQAERWPGRYDEVEQVLDLPGWAPGMPDYDDEILT